MPAPAGATDLSRPGRDRFALRHRKAHRQECLCYLDCATRPFPTGSESRTRGRCRAEARRYIDRRKDGRDFGRSRKTIGDAPTDGRKTKRRQFVCTALTGPANAAALHFTCDREAVNRTDRRCAKRRGGEGAGPSTPLRTGPSTP